VNFSPISVEQPLDWDIVDNPAMVGGIGSGFEGDFVVRVRDGDGNELNTITVHRGGGLWANFQVQIPFENATTSKGTLEVFDVSAKDGSEVNKVIVPIIFGSVIRPQYQGFLPYSVQSGDTLSSIAARFYNDENDWEPIFEANQNQITDPNLIFTGQVLRIPF
jgi:hypothetical protein